MTAMISELYMALKEANVPDAVAQKAAEAVAPNEGRFERFEFRLDALSGELKQVADEVKQLSGELKGLTGEVKEIAGELKLLKWMIALVFGGIASLVVKTFF